MIRASVLWHHLNTCLATWCYNINVTGCNWPQKWTKQHLAMWCCVQFCGCTNIICAPPPLNALMYVCVRGDEWTGRREINFEPPAQLIEMSRKEWLSINHKSQLNRVPRPALSAQRNAPARSLCLSYSRAHIYRERREDALRTPYYVLYAYVFCDLIHRCVCIHTFTSGNKIASKCTASVAFPWYQHSSFLTTATHCSRKIVFIWF